MHKMTQYQKDLLEQLKTVKEGTIELAPLPTLPLCVNCGKPTHTTAGLSEWPVHPHCSRIMEQELS